MDQRILKKGRIDNVDGTRITIFSHEGQCKDTFAIIPEDADSIREDIGQGTEVFYVVQGSTLLGIGAEEYASDDLRLIYDISPKEKRCVGNEGLKVDRVRQVGRNG